MIENLNVVEQVFDIINTAIEASWELLEITKNRADNEFQSISNMLSEMIEKTIPLTCELGKEAPGLKTDIALQSCVASLKRIRGMYEDRFSKALMKIEFELIPILEEARINLYYWGVVAGDEDKEKQYYESDMHHLSGNRYTEEAIKSGEFKYDLSIFVLAYNKSNYTKMCLASLFENLPQNLTYELILVNNGSSDDTESIFNNINPHKQIDIEINGAGMNMISRIFEGRYLLSISNDVLVQERSIENLYECISSADDIGVAVPATPNVSNFQAPKDAIYDDLEGLRKYANEKNNAEKDWEQRSRLVDPISIVDAKVFHVLNWGHYYTSDNWLSFPDDRMSLILRRNNYKMMLVNNAFCHHFGSITIKDDQSTNSSQAYKEGRKVFWEKFGIDPWEKCCYSYALNYMMKYDRLDSVNILDIEAGLGGNALRFKYEFQQKNPACQVNIVCTESRDVYMKDLQKIADERYVCKKLSELPFCNNGYDYVIFEVPMKQGEDFNIAANTLMGYLHEKGTLIMQIYENVLETIKKNHNLENVNFVCDENKNFFWIMINKSKIRSVLCE